jgi:hypothetical protein
MSNCQQARLQGMNTPQEGTILHLHKPPRHEHSSRRYNAPTPQASNAPMLLLSQVLLQFYPSYMITPSTQTSSSQVQSSMQATKRPYDI